MHTQAGKGDRSRVSDPENFKHNLDEVNLPRVPCAQDPSFVKSKRGYVKIYGQSNVQPSMEVGPLPESEPPTTQSTNEIAPEL